MKITLFGAAGDVTGTAYYIETQTAKVLVDFGAFQGGRIAETLNRKLPPVDIRNLDAVALTHAHLDHTGRTPMLVRAGYRNPVWGTSATLQMTSLILHDSAKVKMFDTERDNRKRARAGQSPLTPLYTDEDVKQLEDLFQPIGYNRYETIADGVQIRAFEAGHILGSSSIELTVDDEGKKKVILFSGDIGPQGMAILKDPDPGHYADLVFMETTYGDRDHRSLKDTLEEGEKIIKNALTQKGKILVPSFAVGRTQQLLYYIATAFHAGIFPKFPVYVDSPMAIEASHIYMQHPELYDAEMLELEKSGSLKADLSSVRFCSTPQESMALNSLEGPLMIMAGSGMCNAGRILHHLRHNLWRPETSVIIVGYQAEGSLGRRLVDGAKSVRIFGEDIAVRASIHLLGGLSAHAGQTDLLRWFDHVAGCKPKLVLTHGEDKARIPFATLIKEKYKINPILPAYGDVIVL